MIIIAITISITISITITISIMIIRSATEFVQAVRWFVIVIVYYSSKSNCNSNSISQ